MQNKQVRKFDEKVKNHLNQCLFNINNAIEKSIIKACLQLTNIYSFSEYQTYPRLEHPLKSKQKDVYFTMVAILLSLRTTLENEQKATECFLNNFININKVLEIDVNTLANIIQCAGMPNKKAETIIKASKFVKEKWNNNFANRYNSEAESFNWYIIDEILNIISTGKAFDGLQFSTYYFLNWLNNYGK